MAADDASPGQELIPRFALERVPGWSESHDRAAIVALENGTVNRAWRIETAAGRFALRLQPAGAAALGADRHREVLLHAIAARAGIAPAIVHADPLGRFTVTELLEGRHWTEADFADPNRLAAVGELLARVHALPVPAAPRFDPLGIVQGYVDTLAAARPADAERFARSIDTARELLDQCMQGARALAVIHSDPHHGNLIGDPPMLLDWEYASVGDPIFDLGCVLAYYPRAVPFGARLLESAGLPADASMPALRAAGRFYILLNGLWEEVRRGAGIGPPTSAHCRSP